MKNLFEHMMMTQKVVDRAMVEKAKKNHLVYLMEMNYNAQDKALLTEEDKEAIRNMTWESIALKLYGILDDIDTADDMCKENVEAFNHVVMDIQAKKNNYLYSPDGYSIQRVSEMGTVSMANDDYEPEDPNKKFKDFVKSSDKVSKKADKQRTKQAKKDKKKHESIQEGLQDHARKEMELAGLFSKDSDYDGMIGEVVMDLVDAFVKAGHSGFSADWTRQVFSDLAEWKNLTPITNNPDEWMDISEMQSGEPGWQCTRNPSLFSKDEGKTYYDLNDPEFGKELDEVDEVPWEDRVEWHTSVDMKEGESDFKDLEVNRKAEHKAEKRAKKDKK